MCNYIFYSQLIMSIMAMFWVEMFYLCGRGGYTTETKRFIDDRPWRIVMPALVFFAVFTILQIKYVNVLTTYLNALCDKLRLASIEHREKDCEYLIGINSEPSGEPHYRILSYTSTLSLAFWLIATMIMVIRVLRAPDFAIVRDKCTRKEIRIPPTVYRICENNSREKMIFLNRDFASSRSVHFQ